MHYTYSVQALDNISGPASSSIIDVSKSNNILVATFASGTASGVVNLKAMLPFGPTGQLATFSSQSTTGTNCFLFNNLGGYPISGLCVQIDGTGRWYSNIYFSVDKP